MDIPTDPFFRSLTDPTRLRCLLLLLQEGELCVCELTHALNLSQPKISRHLAYLRDAGVVQDRREGHWVYYDLHPELSHWMRDVLHQTAAGIGATAPFVDDHRRLCEMPNRPGAACCA